MSSRYAECGGGVSGQTGQRGVALITVLLVFALATILITAMLRSGYLAIRRTANLVDSVQARYYALGAEELGRQILQADLRLTDATAAVDWLGEEWAQPGMSFEIEDGLLELDLIDQSGLFNLNSLVDDKGRADPVSMARFGRLLRELALDPGLAESTADWIDSDGLTRQGGNERSAYADAVIPNQPLVDITEMRAIPGVTPAVWQKLADQITVLPRKVLLNVNTAPELVLRSYANPGGLADVERFVHIRKQQPVRNLGEAIVGRLFGTDTGALAVSSEFFAVRAHARYRERHARIVTLMQRDPKSGKILVLSRSDAAKM